jgi:hypothetical protein
MVARSSESSRVDLGVLFVRGGLVVAVLGEASSFSGGASCGSGSTCETTSPRPASDEETRATKAAFDTTPPSSSSAVWMSLSGLLVAMGCATYGSCAPPGLRLSSTGQFALSVSVPIHCLYRVDHSVLDIIGLTPGVSLLKSKARSE